MVDVDAWLLVSSSCSGIWMTNVLPLMGLLETVMVPPINCSRFLQMARPRPLPPYSRVIEVSACWKDSKMVDIRLGSMPMPVSSMLTCSRV